MTASGDGTGAISMAGNYSASAGVFYVQPSVDYVYLVGTVLIAVSDDAKFTQAGYGGAVGPLTNGIQGFIKKDGVEVDAFAGNRFKANVDWYGVGSEVVVSSFDTTPQTLSIKFETYGDTGGYIILDGRSGDQIGLRINDDLSGLVKQIGVVRGIRLYRPWSILN
jgi:hypothetical protein